MMLSYLVQRTSLIQPAVDWSSSAQTALHTFGNLAISSCRSVRIEFCLLRWKLDSQGFNLIYHLWPNSLSMNFSEYWKLTQNTPLCLGQLHFDPHLAWTGRPPCYTGRPLPLAGLRIFCLLVDHHAGLVDQCTVDLP